MPTLRESYEHFIRPTKHASRSTLSCDLAAIKWFENLVPDVQSLSIQKISTREVSLWRALWLNTGLTPQTWNKHARHVKAIFRELYDQELLQRVPRFKSLPEDDPEVRIASGDELQQLLTKCSIAQWPRPAAAVYWRTLITCAVCTGLRRRDLLSVRRADVDTIRKLLTYRAKKTRKLRVIPVSEECLVALKEQMRHSTDEFVWYSTAANRQWYREWSRIKTSAGICGRLDFHDLRSTCGSRVYQKAGLAAASEILAHSSLAVTRRHYISTAVASESLRLIVDSLRVADTIPETSVQES